MVEMVQEYIKAEGFSQIIEGTTISWRTHQDSLLDHIWVNCPQRVISKHNISCRGSDHNIINVTIAMKDGVTAGTTVEKDTGNFFTRKDAWTY